MKKQGRFAAKGKRKGGVAKKKMGPGPGRKLSRGQKKMDLNRNNRIDKEDFALLRKKNSKKKKNK